MFDCRTYQRLYHVKVNGRTKSPRAEGLRGEFSPLGSTVTSFLHTVFLSVITSWYFQNTPVCSPRLSLSPGSADCSCGPGHGASFFSEPKLPHLENNCHLTRSTRIVHGRRAAGHCRQTLVRELEKTAEARSLGQPPRGAQELPSAARGSWRPRP